ncbi:MAG: pitrilysin family protein [bacterium]
MKRGITEVILDSGIQVITENMPWAQSVAVGIWIDRGSRDHGLEKTGLTHFFEHMVFRGTRNHSGLEIAKSLERYGGVLNAFTGKEQTCFYAHISSEYLNKALDILRDLVFYPAFPNEYIEREKLIILEEINALEDNPEDVVHEELWKVIWPENPVGNPIIGFAPQVKAFNLNDLINEHELMLSSPVIIAAAGNISFEQLAEAFNSCNAKKVCREKRDTAIATGGKYQFIKKDVSHFYLCLGSSTFSYSNRYRFALSLLNTILGDGMSSRFFQKIRENHGLAYTIFSSLDFMSDDGIFNVLVGTEPDNAERVLDLICEEIKLIKQGDIRDEELDFAKSHVKGNMILASENVNHRMGRLARNMIYLGHAQSLAHNLELIERVTMDDIVAVIKEVFNRDKFSLITAGSAEKRGIFERLEF